MKKIVAPVLTAALIICLCACGVRPLATGSDLSSASDLGEKTELSYKFGFQPLRYISENGEPRQIYLTSITLRETHSICTYLRQDGEELGLDFPELTAKTKDGEAYTLTPARITDGTVIFSEVPSLPLDKITTLVSGDATIDLTSGVPSATDGSAWLNRISSMSWHELFAYCIGSAGAYSEGAYGELAKRMIADPEEFALRLLAPAYDFGPSAKDALAAANITSEFYDSYGFDDTLELEICIDICAACLAPDTAAVIDTLQTAGGAENNRVAKLLTEALTHIR